MLRQNRHKPSGIGAGKKWRRFIYGDDGAVSIYLVIAATGILLLMSVLVDFARVAAFRKQLELSAESGIRSSLSAYDESLYERYGLFGAGGTDRNAIFSRVAQHNWEASNGRFRLLDIQYGSSHVNSYEVLGTHAVFKRQVLEEMKYKAPIDFTLEVASRFAPAASAMKEASATVRLLGQIRGLYDKREAHLAKVLSLQREAAKAGEDGIAELVPVKLHHAIAGNTALSVAAGYGAYLDWIRHDASLKEGEMPLFSEAIASFASNARSVSGELRSNSRKALSRHQELEKQAYQELEEARKFNDEMQQAVRNMIAEEGKTNTGYDRVGNNGQLKGASPSGASTGDLAQMQQSRQAVQQLILPLEWFDSYRNELSSQTAAFASFDSEAAGFQSSVSASLGGGGSAALLTEGAAQLRLAYEQYAAKYIEPGTVINAREQQMKERQSTDAEHKKKEAEAKSKLGEVRSMLHGITAVPQLEEHQQLFDEVRKRFEANLAFNQLADADGSETADVVDDPEDASEASMSQMGAVFGGIADMLDGIRDPLYLNEYVVHRFHTFDPQKLQAIFENGDKNEFAHALSFNNQEAEYVLYGFYHPSANIAAAYGEIFSVRLAVRTMEGLIEYAKTGNPLLVLVSAVLYGIEKSLEDMMTLARTGSTPFSKYVSVQVSYLDYLRLFLMLHGGGESRTARMIAVIEQNTGFDLSRTSTGLSGELKASVNLWFLPGVIKSFVKFGVLSGYVKGGRYEETTTIGWSYG
ncbi:hypothetical protein [Paenibacillus humicola]|uniref:hypothetical protein n=1 Tax=Paenibacillus humicola TaxID=3110540 RepID=UPI00237C2382|nr:hypothetical protein [Paenibacillus humicola]